MNRPCASPASRYGFVKRDKEFDPVRCTQEVVMIPTYPVQDPDPNPMFFENRVYQGSSGKVYPNPFTDQVRIYFGSAENEEVEIRITDLTGNLVSVLKRNAVIQSVSIGDSLPEGVYLLSILYPARQEQYRIIKLK